MGTASSRRWGHTGLFAPPRLRCSGDAFSIALQHAVYLAGSSWLSVDLLLGEQLLEHASLGPARVQLITVGKRGAECHHTLQQSQQKRMLRVSMQNLKADINSNCNEASISLP